MFILKWINLIGIIIICTYIGILKSKTYENRVIELNMFQNALIMFKTEIEFTYEPLKSIFSDISKVIYENKENIFLNTINKNKNIYEAWSESINDIKNNLLDEDKEIIRMLGQLLGKTDIKGQVNEILLTQNLIEKQIEKAEYEKNKNMKLYKTMGIVLGLGICILLI